jgi:hypothetical protein
MLGGASGPDGDREFDDIPSIDASLSSYNTLREL